MAVAIQVVQYQAEDGSLFLTAAEADAHDFKLKNGAKIEVITEGYLNTIKAIDRSRSIQGNAVANFLAFYLPRVEAGIELEPVERTVFDTPKEAKAVDGTEAVTETEAAAEAGDAVGDEVKF